MRFANRAKVLFGLADSFNIHKILFVLFILSPVIISLSDIWLGKIPFWYDPARDFLLGLDNLKKPRLIGPETGIPGIFYGPYWIWLLSVALWISKDPRFVATLIMAVPYFILFPLVLYRITRNYDKAVFVILWLMFILTFRQYSTYLWNPHLAPVLILVHISLLTKVTLPAKTTKSIGLLWLYGFASGLLLSFHLSFGFGFLIATFLTLHVLQIPHIRFNFGEWSRITKSVFKHAGIFIFGIIVAFTPTMIFEARHGFQQLRALQTTIVNTVIYDSDVVGQRGISMEEIPLLALKRGSELIGVPAHAMPGILIVIIVIFLITVVGQKKVLQLFEKRILFFVGVSYFSILLVYFSTNNPVWDYHFIGFEILFLVFFGIILSRVRVFQALTGIWVLYLVITTFSEYRESLPIDATSFDSLASKEAIVDWIFADIDNREFVYQAYSPSIYTYDYDYLFPYLAERYGLNAPQTQVTNNLPVYLIIPPSSEEVMLDFINYKTPNEMFKTISEVQMRDNTVIFRREPLASD